MRELKRNEVRIIDEVTTTVEVGRFVEYTVYLRVTEIEKDGIIGELIPDVEWHKMGRRGFGPVTMFSRRYAAPDRDSSR